MRLNWRGSVRSHSENSPGRLLGLRPHCASSSRSALNRSLQVRQSMSGSLKPATWPDASQTAGLRITAESMATMSSRSCTIARSHCERMWFFIRSEEHTSELQSRVDLVCRLLLEKKKNKHAEVDGGGFVTSVICN